MNFTQAIQSGFRKYASATGRASRSEFWYWNLFEALVLAAAFVADMMLFGTTDGGGPVYLVTSLALFLPSVAVMIRRLHDIDRTGWWVLISLTGIGLLLLLYLACVRGTDGPNQYGSDPLAQEPLPAARIA